MAAVGASPDVRPRVYLDEELSQDVDTAAVAASAAGSAGAAHADTEVDAEAGEAPGAHLGVALCSVVGMRYYDGVIHQGEWVELVRQPHNPYDANAIRVDNMTGTQVRDA